MAALTDQGIITEVVRPLMSGKEAQLYLVVADREERVAKIYKEATNRSFKHRSVYTEGRGARNTRDARAMSKGTRYGRAKDEDAWRSAEVEIIHRLRAAGVRVPEPFQFIDGILIMELIKNGDGNPAPRLAEAKMSREEARATFDHLLREVVRMLCAGVVHGDLSEFNVLVGATGLVVIDFPQAIDAARNQNAREILIRDVDNLTTFLARHEPGVRRMPYGQEIWQAYERGELTRDITLTGRYVAPQSKTDLNAVLQEIEDADRDEDRRRMVQGRALVRPEARPAGNEARRGGNEPRRVGPQQSHPGPQARNPAPPRRDARAGSAPAPNSQISRSPAPPAAVEAHPPAKKRRRRRRKRAGGGRT